jgi:hypothetical protein
MINNGISIELGQQITLGLAGTDPDVSPQADYLRLDLIDVKGTAAADGYIFAPQKDAEQYRRRSRGSLSVHYSRI